MKMYLSFPFILFISLFCFKCDSNNALPTGTIAPNFTLNDLEGNEIKLARYRDRNVILFFIGRSDNNSTIQLAKNIEDERDFFLQSNFVPMCISSERPEFLMSFSNKYNLSFEILSDITKHTQQSYGIEEGLGSSRISYIIDKKGIIRDVLDNNDANELRDEVHQAVIKLEKGN